MTRIEYEDDQFRPCAAFRFQGMSSPRQLFCIECEQHRRTHDRRSLFKGDLRFETPSTVNPVGARLAFRMFGLVTGLPGPLLCLRLDK